MGAGVTVWRSFPGEGPVPRHRGRILFQPEEEVAERHALSREALIARSAYVARLAAMVDARHPLCRLNEPDPEEDLGRAAGVSSQIRRPGRPVRADSLRSLERRTGIARSTIARLGKAAALALARGPRAGNAAARRRAAPHRRGREGAA